MRVFVSYAHDANAPLVQRIQDSPDAAGHETWIDTAAIKAGDDWRRTITEGIKRSDWVLAFLSRRAVRDGGVCLDELAIALHEKGGAIATVLDEPQDEVAAPVTLRHIQHLDMHGWAARAAADPAGYEAWYRQALAEILRVLAHPGADRFSGEVEELSRRLRPAAQAADIGPLVEGFTGRGWLLDRVEAWRRNPAGPRLFWLTGAPGSGKSAFATRTAHFGRANVISLSLCRYNIDSRRDAGLIVRTLAFQLATRLHDYRTLLLDRLRLHDPDGSEVARRLPPDLFDWLLVQPLHLCIDGGRGADRLVVVIDALYETIRDGRSELAALLAEAAPRLPSWLGLLVTSRPDSPIVQQLAGVPPCPIAEAVENRTDLEVYARGWLAGSGRPAAEVDALVHRICEASGGNFLYLRKLREGVEAGQLGLDAPEGLPPGLIGLYARWFEHLFPDVAAYERDTLPVLEVLLAAGHPVPESLLTRMFGWTTRTRARRLGSLRGLFERRADGVAPFHKSLRDWLLDEHAAGTDFVVDVAPGQRRLAEALGRGFLKEAGAGELAPPDAFTVAELPRLLAGENGLDTLAALAGAEEWEAVLGRAIATSQTLAARFA